MKNRHILECHASAIRSEHFETASLIYNPIVLDIKLRDSAFGPSSNYRGRALEDNKSRINFRKDTQRIQFVSAFDAT